MDEAGNSIPNSYIDWKHCITVECGIPLTLGFVRERLGIFTDPKSPESGRFRKLYGESHWQNVVQWFWQAQTELQSE